MNRAKFLPLKEVLKSFLSAEQYVPSVTGLCRDIFPVNVFFSFVLDPQTIHGSLLKNLTGRYLSRCSANIDISLL